jgi:L-ascorbate metabolism protein UlaG (beta-lactamase superfamily)
MTITKFEHACFAVEEKGKTVLVDPGIFSRSVTQFRNLSAIIITHQHTDHTDPILIKKLLEATPGAGLYGTRDTAAANTSLPITVMHAGETVSRDGFEIEFFGGEHAEIHSNIPRIENIGMLINGAIFYPGDSFVKHDVEKVKVLLAPAVAPWMKISDTLEYISGVPAEIIVPTHDAILSDEGKEIYDNLLYVGAKNAGALYQRLQVGESIEL